MAPLVISAAFNTGSFHWVNACNFGEKPLPALALAADFVSGDLEAQAKSPPKSPLQFSKSVVASTCNFSRHCLDCTSSKSVTSPSSRRSLPESPPPPLQFVYTDAH
ncbi:hypothetical protein U1Q18_032389 [Sarracenia purpurea var. burkii]